MFIELFSLKFLIAFLVFLAFGIFGWKKLELAPAAVLFLAPFYLFKTQIGWLPLNFLEILIWETAILWLVKKISQKDFNFLAIKKEACFWPVILILLGVIFSTWISTDLETSAGILKSWFLAPLVFAWIVFDLAKTKELIRNYLKAVVFSGAAIALISLFYLVFGHLTFDNRLKAFYLSPNHLAMYLIPALILAPVFWFELKKNWQKILFVIGCLLVVICLYFTFSYAAWLAILVALIFVSFLIFQANLIKGKRFLAILGILAVITVLFLSSQLGNEKMENLLHSNRSSWESRVVIWQATAKILQNHWFLGIGPGMFQKYYLDYQKYFPPYLEWAVPQPHNLYLAFWLQTGLIGFIGFIWLVVWLLKNDYLTWRKTKQPLSLALMAVIIYFLAHGFLDTPYWKNDLALVFWAIAALSCKAGRLFY